MNLSNGNVPTSISLNEGKETMLYTIHQKKKGVCRKKEWKTPRNIFERRKVRAKRK
jgi:hypothetical protein